MTKTDSIKTLKANNEELLKLDIIHADETPYRVLDRERAKDLSGKHAEKPIILYHHGSRKGTEAWDFLTGLQRIPSL